MFRISNFTLKYIPNNLNNMATEAKMESGYANFDDYKYSRADSVTELKRFAQFIIDNAERITNDHFDNFDSTNKAFVDKGLIKESPQPAMSLSNQMYKFEAEYGFTTQKLDYPNSEVYNTKPIPYVEINYNSGMPKANFNMVYDSTTKLMKAVSATS